jgi:hypothetical protein
VVQSRAHFAVLNHDQESVKTGVRHVLDAFPYRQRGVETMLVQFFDNNAFVIALDMASKDTDQADEDADAAASEIKTLFDKHFGKDVIRERQRETELLRW